MMLYLYYYYYIIIMYIYTAGTHRLITIWKRDRLMEQL
jgi:hypothetical protein